MARWVAMILQATFPQGEARLAALLSETTLFSWLGRQAHRTTARLFPNEVPPPVAELAPHQQKGTFAYPPQPAPPQQPSVTLAPPALEGEYQFPARPSRPGQASRRQVRKAPPSTP